jgi:hypothetical protein
VAGLMTTGPILRRPLFEDRSAAVKGRLLAQRTKARPSCRQERGGECEPGDGEE